MDRVVKTRSRTLLALETVLFNSKETALADFSQEPSSW